ncbi:MAG TPA: hypothetical protein VGM91_21545 [Conexibacter sp.]|jgi:hypothetical protein
MRRRALLMLLAALATLVAVWQRSRRRAAAMLAGAQVEHERRPASRSYASRFRSLGWSLLDEPIGPTATELRIGFDLLAKQMELDRIDVRETPSQVFVTVLARVVTASGDGASAAASAEAHEATVSLSAPLNDRELVHAPTDDLLGDTGRPGRHAPASPDL